MSGPTLSLEVPASVAPTAQDLLAVDEEWLIGFLNDCRTEGGGFDISRVVGVDGLPPDEREALAVKLCAAAATAGPLNTDELSKRLGLLADGQDAAGDALPSLQRQSSYDARTPTEVLTSPPENNTRYEIFCHDELVKAGGRPAAPLELILSTPEDPEDNIEVLFPWIDGINLMGEPLVGGDVPPLFSTQLEDWQAFQQRWQWDNRGKLEAEEGFSAFLESHTRFLLHKGRHKYVSCPTFEEESRMFWNQKQRYLETSGSDGFVAYTRAVEKRLTSHGFTQAFRLAEDPRQQDAWTTWVEYLSYTYCCHDRYVNAMSTSEHRYRKAWAQFQGFVSSQPSLSPSTGSLVGDLDATKAELEATMQQVNNFMQKTKAYRWKELAARRRKMRAYWILEQLSSIETERKAAEHDTSANVSRKRESSENNDPHDPPAHQPPKRRKQEASHDDSVLDAKPVSRDGSGITTAKEATAPLSIDNPELR
ncbi:hypothetical protein GGS24DRAFT_482530 [Hypoxylon argillaceum]|nr:hypothetical protein GGS24DRAFT_482530 [Hypoxylon argillaceum]